MAILNEDAPLLAEFIDEDGSPYTPTPAPTLDLFRINAADFSVDTLETDAVVTDTGAGGIFGFEVAAADNDALGTLMAVWTTTDTGIPLEFRTITTYETVEAAVSVDPTTIAAAVWDYATSALNVAGSIGKWLLETIAVIRSGTDKIGAGATFVQSDVDPKGNVTLYHGKKQVLHWTSTSTRDFAAGGVAVKFEYHNVSFDVTVTGSVGAWEFECEVITDSDIPAFTYDGELAVFEGAQEVKEAGQFKVYVKRNIGSET